MTTTSDFADIDYASTSKSSSTPKSLEFNSADIRNSLNRKTSSFHESVNLNEDPQANRNNDTPNSTNTSLSGASNLDSATESYKNGPPISSNGALAPPPYRNPPSPKTNSPLLHQQLGYSGLFENHQRTDSQSSGTTNSSKVLDFGTNKSSNFMKEMSPPPQTSLLATSATSNRQPSPNIHINVLSNLQSVVNSATSEKDLLNDNHFQNAQYRELLQLIHFQREKINNQQVDISKVC